MATSTIKGNLYDYPAYYDIVFGSDWQAEYQFLLDCYAQHGARPLATIFEPACGTGRLLYRLGKEGYQVAGNDLNPHAVEYCNERLERHDLAPAVTVGDMSNFELTRQVDLMFNFINTFRHLQREREALGHLECVAASLAKGGLFLLGLHLTPTEGPATDSETWSAKRGQVSVEAVLKTTSLDRDEREERVGMKVTVKTPKKKLVIHDELVFRTYTARQMQTLLRRVRDLECVAVYDFAYDLAKPVKIEPTTEDVIYVLRKL